jgi:lipopolysaccharide/colanic/teichoic acid biosynthesis glycosyltransferase
VKKNLAAYRYIDEKVVPLYMPEAAGPSVDRATPETATFDLSIKRAFDLFFSVFVLVFGFPFFALIALLVKLTSSGPMLFVQERVGLNGKPFRLYKFRTMATHSNDVSHRQFTESFIKGNVTGEDGFKMTEDPRVTSIGRFLRKTSLDELPQFINVIKGEMSVVGPRPPLTYELDHYKEWHRRRLTARPGLTGLWQVSGRSTVPFDEMVMLDVYYIEHRSLLLDLKIVLRTLPVMFYGSGGC